MTFTFPDSTPDQSPRDLCVLLMLVCRPQVGSLSAFFNNCLSRLRASVESVAAESVSGSESSSIRMACRSRSNCFRSREQYLHIEIWNRIIRRWDKGNDRSMDSESLRDISLQLNIQCFIRSPAREGFEPVFFQALPQAHAGPVQHDPAVGRCNFQSLTYLCR